MAAEAVPFGARASDPDELDQTMHIRTRPADGPADVATRPLRRVLFFGKNMSRTHATGGLVEALVAHGLDVTWLNMATLRRWLGRRLAIRYAAWMFEHRRPDLVFVFCRDLPFELLVRFRERARTVVWFEEPLDDIAHSHAEYLAQAHAVFMTNPSKFDWLEAHGVPHTAFVMEGFSSTYHYPAKTSRPRRDIAFIGGPGRRGQRVEFLAEVSRHFDLEVFGCGWERHAARHPELRVRPAVRAGGYRKLCASSRIVLGLNQVNDDLLYFSNRTLFTLACRGFHLTHYVPRLESVFCNGVHLAWFSDIHDCLEKIAYYLERPEERARIAAAGYEYALAEHQFTARISFILKALREGLPVGVVDRLRVVEPVRAVVT
jgi:hypothetical protein